MSASSAKIGTNVQKTDKNGKNVQKKASDTDELLELALWYNRLKRTNNEKFLPLFADEHRFLVLKGGGGSGKSIFAGRKLIERAVSEDGHRFLVCRKVGRTIRESCFRQLTGQASDLLGPQGFKANQTDMTIAFPNGSVILSAGLDDVEKLKSIYNVTGIWIEEASEVLESDFDQLDIRLRGKTKYYKQMILTFNPVSSQHWLKKRFFDRADARAYVHESTYHDNRFLDEEAKATLEGFRETDFYYYQVYCLGQWGVTGKSVFNAAAVSERLADAPKPIDVGYFDFDYDGEKIENIRFVSDPDGFIKIWHRPGEGVPYVIGCDTAGDGSDSFVAQVIDNASGEQVCVLRHTFDEDVFTKQIYCLGMYYNTALMAVEVNLSTYPVMELERLGYPNQYVRESFDDFTHKPKLSYGFRTDSKTRPVIIAELIKYARENIDKINDDATLSEMLTFVRNEAFRPEAEAGAHDDCVMSLAIANHIRPLQRTTVEIERERIKWTASMWEDYRNASREEKKYLLEKWGAPKR